MAPERSPKRAKTDASVEESRIHADVTSGPSDRIQLQQEDQTTLESRRSSWYSRTWPRKAAPVTQIARESISSATNAPTEAVATVSSNASLPTKSARSPSLAMTLGKSTTNRSIPVNATTTKIHATSEASTPRKPSSSKPEPPPPASELSEQPQTDNGRIGTHKPSAKLVVEAQLPVAKAEKDAEVAQRTVTDSIANLEPDRLDGSAVEAVSVGAGWLGWFSRSTPEPGKPTADTPNSAAETRQAALSSESAITPTNDISHTIIKPTKESEGQPTINNKRTWLQMWSNDPHQQASPSGIPLSTDTTVNSSSNNTSLKVPNIPTSNPTKSPSHSKASSVEIAIPPAIPADGSKSSGWVFWSRDRNAGAAAPAEDLPHVGEIAISNTPSQGRPKRASLSLPNSKDGLDPAQVIRKEISKAAPEAKKAGPPGKGKLGEEPRPSSPITKVETPKAAMPSKAPEEPRVMSLTESAAALKKTVPNLVLPSFKTTFSLQENPSILQQLGRLLYYTKPIQVTHLAAVRDPPRIKSALAIGVHGYFPVPLIRSVLGQPTGTSIKFADMAAKAIRRWTTNRGYECQVKTAALEGEGRIAERIELLWKLLLNWIDEINKADFVMIACHSQGVPVAMMLVAKLISFGCVNSARVGICAMAGVSMGPFQEYKSRWISGSAGELFDFSNPSSRVSVDYLSALETALKFGVRVTFVGSIDDQLVSLESSVFSPITHPHIFRAVFVDGRVHAPNFLAHLVGFALKLRNLGVPDHGVIRELSSPLAGSLYSGEGHSRIYEDEAVYDLAVEFALETTEIKNAPMTQRPYATAAGTSAGANPYILPFAMRGVLEEEYVKTELHNEAVELLQQFDDWKPTTKQLKDVKFRLEGIRSRL